MILAIFTQDVSRNVFLRLGVARPTAHGLAQARCPIQRNQLVRFSGTGHGVALAIDKLTANANSSFSRQFLRVSYSL